MIVHPDGSYEWQADIMSNDSNDKWEGHFEWLSSIKSMLCKTNDGLLYYMKDEKKWYRWQFTSDLEKECLKERFNDIQYVALVCKC